MSIGKRLNLGFLAVCSLILIVGLLGLILSMQVRGLRNVELPMEQNLREVEVSIWETIHAADAFRLTGMPYYEELYHKQLADVNEFFPRYEAMIDTEEEKAYIREFNALWNEAKSAGDKMIALTKAQEEQEKLFFEVVDGADEVIDSDIQAKWSPDDSHRLAKEQAVREVEVSIWEAIHAAHQYVGLSGEARKFKDLYTGGTKETDFAKLMTKQFGDVDEFLPKYKALATTRWERAAIARFEGFWKQAVRAGNEMLRLHGEAEGQFKILYENVDKADDVIDYKMQAYVQKRIEREDLTAGRIKNITIAVVLFSLFFAVVISMRITRSIARPIKKLKEAADEIGKGRLDAIVEIESKDELGDLATTFNNMAALRKAAEEAIAENEERYSDLFENVNDLVQCVTADGLYVYVNAAWRRTLGYSEEDVKKLTIMDVIHHDSMAHCMKIFQRLMAGEEVGTCVAVFKSKDGRAITVEGNINCKFENGKPVYTRGIFRDITERKMAEEALRESEERFRKLFENSNDAIFIHTVDGRILDANSQAENMMGYPVAVLKTMPVPALHPPEELETSKKAFEETISKGSAKFESRFLHSGGAIIDVEISSRIVDREKGIIQGIVRDITARKKTEAELKRVYGEIQEKSKYLERFNRLMVGRELEMIKLKTEVNELLEKYGQPKKYEAPDEVKDLGR